MTRNTALKTLLGSLSGSGAPADGKRGLTLAPPPTQQGIGGSRRPLLLVLSLLLVLGLLYMLGRSVESARAALVQVPLVGQALFAEPVRVPPWAQTPQTVTTAPPPIGQESPPAIAPQTLALQEEIAVRLAAAQMQENALQQREATLKAQEEVVASETARAAEEARIAANLRQELQSKLQAEQGQVAVVRAMKRSAQEQLFTALTDDEAIRLLVHMEADEVARILAAMDPWRSARLLQRLTRVGAD